MRKVMRNYLPFPTLRHKIFLRRENVLNRVEYMKENVSLSFLVAASVKVQFLRTPFQLGH